MNIDVTKLVMVKLSNLLAKIVLDLIGIDNNISLSLALNKLALAVYTVNINTANDDNIKNIVSIKLIRLYFCNESATIQE
jgi:hypothetical protein